MGGHRTPEPVGQAELLREMALLLVVMLAAWVLSLLPGAWGLLAFGPGAVLAAVIVAPMLIEGWRAMRHPAEEEE